MFSKAVSTLPQDLPRFVGILLGDNGVLRNRLMDIARLYGVQAREGFFVESEKYFDAGLYRGI